MDKVTCKCGHSFSFKDGVKKNWKDGFMHWWVTCPECKSVEYVCKLSKSTVTKRRTMIKRAKRYQRIPIPENKKSYQVAVDKFQRAFDHDNQQSQN